MEVDTPQSHDQDEKKREFEQISKDDAPSEPSEEKKTDEEKSETDDDPNKRQKIFRPQPMRQPREESKPVWNQHDHFPHIIRGTEPRSSEKSHWS